MYPLDWPTGVARSERREASKFRASLSRALENVETSLRLFGGDTGRKVQSIVLSSNVAGLRTEKPTDPGVAAWFHWDGEWRCIAVDRYLKVEENLQAIHHIIEARRVEMRHGGLTIVRSTFKGFTPALEAPGSKSWWSVLGVQRDADLGTIRAAYNRLARERHPDTGGSDEMMAELNQARDAALQTAGA